MNCGAEILVRDVFGSNEMRFIAQCHGRYLLISNGFDFRNGYYLQDWRYVLRELVSLTVPEKLTDRHRDVQSAGSGTGHLHGVPADIPAAGAGAGRATRRGCR